MSAIQRGSPRDAGGQLAGIVHGSEVDRVVLPELLDELPAENPRAMRSRRDLQRLNRLMTSAEILAGVFKAAFRDGGPRHIVELGAGDGTLLLSVARRLPDPWRGTEVLLLDRQKLLGIETARAYADLGWRVSERQADMLEWADEPVEPCDLILANLFLHHFTDAQLAGLLPKFARRTRVFVALEPRRSRLFLLVSRMLWLVGCNRITRHDATVSVRAGFTGAELTKCWPRSHGWVIRERAAGRFTHLFFAANPGHFAPGPGAP